MTISVDWRGRSHARMTPSMDYLPLPAYKILSHLRRIIPDNEARAISQSDIARGARVSESSVSKYMPLLIADGWIDRSARQATGRGHGYAITVLPPPELLRTLKGSRPSVEIVAPSKGSRGADGDDPLFAASDATIPESKGSRGASPNNIEQEHDQQQQIAPDSELLAELAGDDPSVVVEVIRLNPGMTTAEFRAQLAAAQERPNVYNPRGLVLRLLANGQRVTPARRSEPRQGAPRGPRNDKRPWDTPDDLATYFAAQNAAQRAATVDMEAEPPDDATPEERRTWHALIAAGESPAQALNHLLTRRYQAAHLPPVKVEARYAQR